MIFKAVGEGRPYPDHGLSRREWIALPPTAQAYVRALEEMSGAPFASIGVGPDREQTLELRPLL